jgi:hypothetical protein
MAGLIRLRVGSIKFTVTRSEARERSISDQVLFFPFAAFGFHASFPFFDFAHQAQAVSAPPLFVITTAANTN